MSLELLASGARTSSGAGAAVGMRRYDEFRGAVFVLQVTAGGSQAGDLLDVFVQSYLNNTVVDDLLRFTQVLGNAPVKTFAAYWIKTVAQATPMRAPTDGTMSAGINQGGAPGLFRVKYNITNGGGTHTFTFSVTMEPF